VSGNAETDCTYVHCSALLSTDKLLPLSHTSLRPKTVRKQKGFRSNFLPRAMSRDARGNHFQHALCSRPYLYTAACELGELHILWLSQL